MQTQWHQHVSLHGEGQPPEYGEQRTLDACFLGRMGKTMGCWNG